MRSARITSRERRLPRLVPRGIRPIAALLIAAIYAAVLVRLPSPMASAAISLAAAEVVILPPGDPEQVLAALGRPESAAAQANDQLDPATPAPAPELTETALKPVEPEAIAAVEAVSSVEARPVAMPIDVEPPIKAVETAVAISARDLEPSERAEPAKVKKAEPAPAKRDAVKPVETKQRKAERRPEVAKPKSAASAAQQGQAGLGGGQRNGQAQSIAEYGSHVRSVLVSRTQRISSLRSVGQVALSFTINASGQLASVSVSSSGSAEIERAIRAAVMGASFQPPPNGRFAGSITITVR